MVSRNPIVIIGLDGVPLSLIKPWIEAGELPTMQRFLHHGVVGNLRSTMPPTSGPSWSSFMTGKHPGKTGIYDFLYRAKDTYHFPPVNASLRDGRELWEILNDAGLKVGVFNVPLTYPVKPVDGFMISGWMTPYTATDYAHPPELGHELQRAIGNYRIYPTTTYSPGRAQAFLQASLDLLEMRTRTALYLLQREQYDFFMTVIFDTDRVLHQLWHFLDPKHPWHGRDGASEAYQQMGADILLTYFRHVDRSLEKLFAAAGENALKIVMSDHGMGSAHNFVVLNNWLLENHFLSLKHNPLTLLKRGMFEAGITLRNVHKFANKLGLAKYAEYKGLYSTDWLLKLAFLSFNDVDWSHSVAYSFGRHYGPVYINVEGHEPHGIVQAGAAYERVRDQIIDAALSFKHPHTGRNMVGRVLKREEVYHGPHLEHAPDLILIPADPRDIFFGLADFGSNRVVDTVYRYSGMHRDHGMLMMLGPQIDPRAPVNDASIVDMTPTVLHVMGLPIPSDMDGKPLLDLFAGETRDRAPRYVDVQQDGNGDRARLQYNKEEEKQIAERLRGLGYLG
ncbi:MAG: alkaline phosphatase family protein [Anaerolineae bacterium]|nr:alkaline phosphatase family protein [Anaerolineae bacterium]